MSNSDHAHGTARPSIGRRHFLKQTGWGSVAAGGLLASMGRGRALAHAPSPYPAWMAPSDNPPSAGAS